MSVIPACTDEAENVYNLYAEWREANDEWLTEQMARTNDDGTPYYQTVVPDWNKSAYVLIHYFNDTSLTSGNLSPMYTSTIDTRYILHLYDGTAVDSSYTNTTYGQGVYRTSLSSTVTGWVIAFETMHVGDSAEIVIPYAWGYGTSSTTSVPPYSNLIFNVSLVNIPYYETSPN